MDFEATPVQHTMPTQRRRPQLRKSNIYSINVEIPVEFYDPVLIGLVMSRIGGNNPDDGDVDCVYAGPGGKVGSFPRGRLVKHLLDTVLCSLKETGSLSPGRLAESLDSVFVKVCFSDYPLYGEDEELIEFALKKLSCVAFRYAWIRKGKRDGKGRVSSDRKVMYEGILVLGYLKVDEFTYLIEINGKSLPYLSALFNVKAD